jgi:hypothetical protein
MNNIQKCSGSIYFQQDPTRSLDYFKHKYRSNYKDPTDQKITDPTDQKPSIQDLQTDSTNLTTCMQDLALRAAERTAADDGRRGRRADLAACHRSLKRKKGGRWWSERMATAWRSERRPSVGPAAPRGDRRSVLASGSSAAWHRAGRRPGDWAMQGARGGLNRDLTRVLAPVASLYLHLLECELNSRNCRNYCANMGSANLQRRWMVRDKGQAA